MDTILNLGLNDETVKALSNLTNNEKFAYDTYRRFIQMFSDIVMKIEKIKFQDILDEVKENKKIKFDNDLDLYDLKEIVEKYKALYRKEIGREFPQDPKEQLLEGIKAVFRSWNNQRAVAYRKLNNIPTEWEQLLTFKQWYLEIWGKHQEQELHLQEIHVLEKSIYLGNT